MRPIFRNAATEAQFRAKGFVKVPFIGSEEAIGLKQELLKFSPSDNYAGGQETRVGRPSYHVTFFDSNAAYRQHIFNFVKDRFSEAMQGLLADYKCAQANVFLKPPGQGLLQPHQNLSIADEKLYTTLSFWLPLQDTTPHNGTVFLIPGSQQHFLNYRNTHVRWAYQDFFTTEKGLSYFEPVNVRAGELLLLDDRIVHYTPVNQSAEGRWVLHSLWAPQEARLQFYDPSDSEVRVHDVEDDFWQFHTPGAMIERTPDLTLPYTKQVFSEQELISLLDQLKGKM